MVLIAGLGNPGPRYRWNRHNVGFMLVDRIALRNGATFQPFSSRSVVCRTDWAGRRLILAKPNTYMNRSGVAVSELCIRYRLEASQVLIVYDEVNLPFGALRLRPAGSAGGHNGMQSVIDALGTLDVPRLRIGICPASRPRDLSAYVLSDFSEEELDVLDGVLDTGCEAVDVLLRQGIERAMSLFNRPPGDPAP